jgi:hypothetical protein
METQKNGEKHGNVENSMEHGNSRKTLSIERFKKKLF